MNESADDFPEDEEFSLEKLSEAYADVRRQRERELSLESADGETRPDPGESRNKDSTEKVEAESLQPADDDAACPVSPESIVESILFVGAPAGVKLTGKKIASVLRDVSPKEVGQIVKRLNKRYRQQDSAIRIDCRHGVYQLVLEPSLTDFQNEYFGRNREVRLAQGAIDVLAVVAYQQPVTKHQVNEIRGKSSGSVLKQLVNRNLIRTTDGDKPKTASLYETTDRFLDLFRLNDIEELPQSHEVSEISLD